MTYIDNDCYIANKGQVKVKVTIIKNKIVGFSLFRVIIIGYWPFIAKSLAGQTVSKFSVFKHWGFQFLNVLGEKYHFLWICVIFLSFLLCFGKWGVLLTIYWTVVTAVWFMRTKKWKENDRSVANHHI